MKRKPNTNNLIRDLIDDRTYKILLAESLLSETGIRDYRIKKLFGKMREEKIRASSAMDKIQNLYPYLSYDALRKIIYLKKK